MSSINFPAAECDIGQIKTSSLILNNSRTVSMLLNSISGSELGYVIHFNNTDNSLYQANIGIL